MWDSSTLQGTINQNGCFRSLSGCRHQDVRAAASPPQTRFPTDSCSFCRSSLPGTSSTWTKPGQPRAVLSDESRQSSRLRSRPPLRDERSSLRNLRPSRHAIASQPSHATGTRPVKVATLGIRRRPPCGSTSHLAAASRTFHRVDPRSCEWEIKTLLCFTSPFPTLPSSPPIVSLRETIGCLSWDFQRSPLRRIHCRRVHSCAPHCYSPLREAANHRVLLVPSPWFFATLTASASSTLHVCCTVLPTMGFVVF